MRNTLQTMHARGLIEPIMFYNPYALGIFEYQAFLSILSKGDRARKKFIKTIQSFEAVSWLGEIGGKFNYDVFIKANSITEVSDFFDDLSARVPDIEYEKAIAALLSLTYQLPKYLGQMPGGIKHQTIRYGYIPERPKHDELDLKILRALIDGPPLPFTHVARRVGISASTLEYRIQTLRARRIILGFGYLISSFSFGYQPYLLMFEMKRLTAAARKKMAGLCVEHSNVTYLAEYLGEWDFK